MKQNKSTCFTMSILTFFNLLFILLPLTGSFVAAQTSASDMSGYPYSVAPVYSNTPMQWIGPSKGVNITLFGTASEITAQLMALDPDWTPANTSTSKRDATSESATWAGKLFCCPVASWGWRTVEYYDIESTANIVSKNNGWFLVQNNACGLVECNKNVGIWLCNDSPDDAWLVADSVIAEYASDDIAAKCPTEFDTYLNCGQQFDDRGFNVIAHGDC